MTRRDKTLDIQEHKQIFLFFFLNYFQLGGVGTHTHTHIINYEHAYMP